WLAGALQDVEWTGSGNESSRVESCARSGGLVHRASVWAALQDQQPETGPCASSSCPRRIHSSMNRRRPHVRESDSTDDVFLAPSSGIFGDIAQLVWCEVAPHDGCVPSRSMVNPVRRALRPRAAPASHSRAATPPPPP